MKCSYCNQEMENGFVQSARDIYLCTEHIEYYEKYGLSILAQE